MHPAISLIVPVYNIAPYIGACLASIRAQSFGDFEAIIVNDGSTDDSLAVISKAIAEDSRFRIITRPNGGLSAARNTGLDAAQGDVIGFVDGDDWLEPDFLRLMHDALTESSADWVSCGLWLDHGEGGAFIHSTVHDAPKLPEQSDDASETVLEDMISWTGVVRHFPSAWNKLYRRKLIGKLRFPVGLLYEDHPFFCACAARTTQMARVPRALYHWRQDRAGRISADASTKLFQQFDILDQLVPIFRSGKKPEGKLAFSQLATRLCYERVSQMADGSPRRAFLRLAQTFFKIHGLQANAEIDPYLPLHWPLILNGEPPVTVVIPTDGVGDLAAQTLRSIGNQSLWWFETILVQSHADAETLPDLPSTRVLIRPGADVAALRNAGLEAATGRFIVFLDAGDTLQRDALLWWVDGMLREGMKLGVTNFNRAGDPRAIHSGLHDDRPFHGILKDGPVDLDPVRAICLHAHPSAKIFDRKLLKAHNIQFQSEPLGAWSVTLAVAQLVDRMFYFASVGTTLDDRPEARRLWHAPQTPAALHSAVQAIGKLMPEPLNENDKLRLLVRAIWEKYEHAEMSEEERTNFLWVARQELPMHAPPPREWFDPYLSGAFFSLLFNQP